MEITEEWVRGLTGWKPFKDGKSMADQCLVTGFKRGEGIFQGTLREGRLNLRPVVKVMGPADVRVQCGCADHRATGGVCSHAVAILLASLKPAPGPPVRKEQQSPVGQDSSSRPPRAWDVHLSTRLESELTIGRVTVRLIPSQSEVSDPDHLLTSWLTSRKLLTSAARPLALSLSGSDTAEFLDLAAGHPRVAIDGRPGPFLIAPDPRPPMRLGDSRLDGSQVVLELAPDEPLRSLVRWGDSPASVDQGQIARLPGRSTRPGWLEQVFKLASNGRCQVPLPDFLADFDAWLDLFEPPQPGWLGKLRLAGARPDFELELEGSLEALDAVLKVRYPGHPARPIPPPSEPFPGLPSLGTDDQLVARRLADEEQARHRLLSLGFESPTASHASLSPGATPLANGSRFQLRGRDRILSFIADDLPDLRRDWSVGEGDRFAIVAGRVHVVRPEIQESGTNRTSLTFELSFQTTGGNRIPSSEIRRLLRGGKRNVRLASGAEVVLSRTCEELVNPLVEELGIGRPDEAFQLTGASSILFHNLRERLLNQQEINGQSYVSHGLHQEGVVRGLKAELRPYQIEGASWVVDRLRHLKGALLADEMGLGKTLQTIAAINYFKRQRDTNEGPSLVVAPTTLLGNWMAELQRFAPDLKCLLFHGSDRDRLRGQFDAVDVIVTSYGTLVRDLAFHLQREYRLVVVDEASLLRNPDAEISKSLFKIRACARLALTGTPVENRMQDLWSIFRFVASGYLGERATFKERYESPAGGGDASPGLIERLRLRISPFVLRRTKSQVARDLPDKVEIDEWLDLSGEQAKLYASLARAGLVEIERIRDEQGEGAGRMHLLTLLLRLRQTCVDPGLLELNGEAPTSVKSERLREMLQEQFASGAKTLVFSQFAKHLRTIETKISEGFGRIFRLDGATRDRQRLVESFQSEPGPAVFLISLKAGGYGLNLTAADTVIHLDPWWNPAVEAQATDRAHRIGQTRPVTVYRLLTRGTVEERVRRMQADKRAVIDAATGDSEGVPRNWTAKDLEGLLE